jgi:amino acid transporter
VIQTPRPLTRILGLGFGLAIVFGGTVGVGILRLPGTLAAALGDSRLIILFWVLGGVYALLGAVAVAELAAMLPEAGGFYVYARRAFGNGPGFVVGWSDWVNQVAAIAYAALTASVFLGTLWPATAGAPRAVAIAVIGVFTALHWAGLRIGSTITNIISLTVGLMLMVLVGGCYLSPPAAASSLPPSLASAVSLPLMSLGMLAAVVTALRSVFVTYDGWYSPIYLAEESTQPALTLPRAIIGGTLLVAAIYVTINLAILRVLPLPVLAASSLPAADAARLVLPRGGVLLVTVISLMTVLSLVNATLLMTPRRLLHEKGRQRQRRRHAAVGARRDQRCRSGPDHERHFRADHRHRRRAVPAQLCLGLFGADRAADQGAGSAAAVSRLRISIHDRARADGLRVRVDRGHHGRSLVCPLCRDTAGRMRAHLRMDRPPAPVRPRGELR